MIRVEEIVEVVESNPLYSWKLRILGCVGYVGKVENFRGDRFWYKNGEFHRLNGPAIEYSNGGKRWLKNGKLHRIDGPAMECLDGTKYWFVEDILYNEIDFNERFLLT